MRTWCPWIFSLLVCAGPASASGQDVTFGAGVVAPAFPRVLVPPAGSFPPGSVAGASVSFGSLQGMVGASVRLPLRPRLWLEGDWTRVAGSGERSFEQSNFSTTPGVGLLSRSFITAAQSHVTNVVGVNLLRPVGTGRVSTLFGVGAGFRRTDASLDYRVRCEPVAPAGCLGRISAATFRFGTPVTGATWQALMGIDAAMTDRASLLVSVRWMQLGEASYDNETGSAFAIDARVRLLRKPREQSSEPPRILRDATLTGLVAGGVVGVILGSRFEEEGRLVVPLFSVGIGTAAGLLLGAISR